ILKNIKVVEDDPEDARNSRHIKTDYYRLPAEFVLTQAHSLETRHGKEQAPGIFYGFDSKKLPQTGLLYNSSSHFHPADLAPLPHLKSLTIKFEYWGKGKDPFGYELTSEFK